MSPLMGQLANLDVMRIISLIQPDNFISDNTSQYYSKKNLDMHRMIAGWETENKNVIDDLNHINDSICTTKNMTFSPELPLLFFTRDDSVQNPREDGKTSVSFYDTYITNSSIQEVIPLDGSHYLHWSCKEEIVSYTNQFVNYSVNSFLHQLQ